MSPCLNEACQALRLLEGELIKFKDGYDQHLLMVPVRPNPKPACIDRSGGILK